MDLSSPGSLLASLAVGSVGLGLFLHGKKRQRLPHLAIGVTMMAYPYFVSGTRPMLAIGAGLLLVLWLSGRVVGRPS